MSKKVSIIIPVYNGEKFIKRTIESCLNQSYSNIEIIAIDDNSTDNSVKIIENMIMSSSSLKIIKNSTNLGIIKTNNLAIQYANGDFFLFLGHDDLLPNLHIEKMIESFDNYTAFVHCNADLIDSDDKIIGVGVDDQKQIIKTNKIQSHLSISNMIYSPGLMINKTYFEKVNGFDERFKMYGEWSLWIKLASIGKVKYNLNTRAYYRRHDTNITNTFKNYEVAKELNNYFNYCHSMALHLFDFNIIEKLYISIFYKGIYYKSYIKNCLKGIFKK